MSKESRLIEFHKKCRKEYGELLEHFNLLFYGYGCKKKVLEFLFPAGIVINGKLHSLKGIMEVILKHVNTIDNFRISGKQRKGNPDAILGYIDRKCEDIGTKITLVFLNFDFKELKPFKKMRNFKIIGTIENTSYDFEFSEIDSFNFIFRDLTTFVPYTEEVTDISFPENQSKVGSMAAVYGNVPKKSRFVFLELLKLKRASKSVFLADIFSLMKKKLLLKNKNECLVLLSEFIDHRLLKTKSDGEIAFEFRDADIHRFLEEHS